MAKGFDFFDDFIINQYCAGLRRVTFNKTQYIFL